ncbi:hypothetical protein ACJJTC_000925 [Scirpophaga incertulas]
MHKSSVLFTLLISSSFCLETVKYAAVIYRHGDRTPVDPYPTDPYRNESLWPVKFGELTKTGIQQHYALGQWFRKRYSHLLSTWYDSSEIYVRSTDIDRTLMSAQANLAGLYPPKGTSIWNKALLWQPIPVHTVPEAEDELLSMNRPCPAYNTEHEKYIHSKTYRERLRKYQPLMDYLTAYTGFKVKNYADINRIYNVLFIENLYKFKLPNWTHSIFPNKLAEPAGLSFTELTATPLMARYKVGPLLKEVLANMFSTMTEKSTKSTKVSIYSCHDLNIGSLLNALGVFDGKCPVYTATILMELIFDDTAKGYFVKISYRNTTKIIEPNVLSIPFCGTRCPLDRFAKLYENIVTVNWERECNKQFPPILGISFFVGLGIFGMIYMVHKICFNKVYRRQGSPI